MTPSAKYQRRFPRSQVGARAVSIYSPPPNNLVSRAPMGRLTYSNLRKIRLIVKSDYMKTISQFLFILSLALTTGCGITGPEKKDKFFTSGSRDADQRATQRMAKTEHITGGAGEAAQVPERQTLFERLGGLPGLGEIVNDFTPRVLHDPRVNWSREGVSRGGLFTKKTGPVWQESPENLARFKKHFGQFLALATGGPAKYEGKQMVNAHEGMEITNPEFDAAIGDLKATLDNLKVPDAEQKELLAIIESTRPQVVTKR